MAVCTISISVQHAIARLLQNTKKSTSCFIFNEFITSTRITALKIRNIYTRSAVVMELTAGMPLLNFRSTRKRHGSSIYKSGAYYTHGSHGFPQISYRLRRTPHDHALTGPSVHLCLYATFEKIYHEQYFSSQLNRIPKTEPVP